MLEPELPAPTSGADSAAPLVVASKTARVKRSPKSGCKQRCPVFGCTILSRRDHGSSVLLAGEMARELDISANQLAGVSGEGNPPDSSAAIKRIGK